MVRIGTRERRTMSEHKSKEDAEAIVKMAIARRGVNEEFYVVESEDAAKSTMEEK